MSEREPSRRSPTGIGEELHDARLGRGYSIEDCQRATRISRRYLEALEEEDFSALPAPVFARGFLRSYAQYLGLDATALVARFPVNPRAPGAAQSVQVPGRDVSPVRLESAAPYYEDEFAQDQALPPIPSVETTPSSFRLGPWLVALFVILVVLAGVVVIVTFGDDDESTPGTVVSEVPGVPLGPAAAEGMDELVTTPISVPEGTILPDFSTATISDVQLWLRRAGPPFVILELFDASAIGLVIDQVPAAGVALDSGATVMVVVSRGPAPAPDEVGPEEAGPTSPAGADDPALAPETPAADGASVPPPTDGASVDGAGNTP